MRVVWLVILLLLALPVMAQDDEQTLFGSDSNIEHGGFGAPLVSFTKINGKLGVLAGARAGWIIGHVLSLGAGGYYLVNNVQANQLGPQNQPYVNMYYGGFDMELILASSAPVHLSLHSLVGGGAVGTRYALFPPADKYGDEQFYDYRSHRHHHEGGWESTWSNGAEPALPPPPAVDIYTTAGPSHMDGFFVVEPGVNLDFNMTRAFRLSLGGSYRWVQGVHSAVSTNKELGGPSATVTFRFGSF